MPPSLNAKRSSITSSINSVADSGKAVTKNMSLTCSISGAFSSIVDAVSDIDLPDIDLPDFELPDFGGDKSLFDDMRKKAEAAASEISEAMSEAFETINGYMEDFDDFMERMSTALEEKIAAMSSAFKASIIAAFGSISAFIEKVYEEAAALVESAVNKVKDFAASASDKISSVVSDMGKSIMDAFDGMSMGDCEGTSESVQKLPPAMQTPGAAEAIKNKGKSKSEALVSSLKGGPATSAVDNMDKDKAGMLDGIKFSSPSNDEIKSKIMEKYPSYFGPGKLDISDVV